MMKNKYIQPVLECDLNDILELQKKAFKEVAKVMDNYDIPPLQQTIDELKLEFNRNVILYLYQTVGYEIVEEKMINSIAMYIMEKQPKQLPQWYVLEKEGEIIGCAGLVTNEVYLFTGTIPAFLSIAIFLYFLQDYSLFSLF